MFTTLGRVPGKAGIGTRDLRDRSVTSLLCGVTRRGGAVRVVDASAGGADERGRPSGPSGPAEMGNCLTVGPNEALVVSGRCHMLSASVSSSL